MAVTMPVTLSPLFKVLIDCSRSSAKSSSWAVSTLISSLIMLLTSFIIHAGVDAPAVMPTDRADEKCDTSSPQASSTSTTSLQCCPQIMASRLVLELMESPMTTIASQLCDSSFASFCLFSVASHIVSNISEFVHCFFIIFLQLSHKFCVLVV